MYVSEFLIPKPALEPNPDERERMLRELPPSAKLVYKALHESGALTSREISSETLLAPRTVRHALKRLRSQRLVNTRPSLRDCRTAYFFLGQNCQRV